MTVLTVSALAISAGRATTALRLATFNPLVQGSTPWRPTSQNTMSIMVSVDRVPVHRAQGGGLRHCRRGDRRARRGSGVRHSRVVGQLGAVERALDQLGEPLGAKVRAWPGVRSGDVAAARVQPADLLVGLDVRAHPPLVTGESGLWVPPGGGQLSG